MLNAVQTVTAEGTYTKTDLLYRVERGPTAVNLSAILVTPVGRSLPLVLSRLGHRSDWAPLMRPLIACLWGAVISTVPPGGVLRLISAHNSYLW